MNQLFKPGFLLLSFLWITLTNTGAQESKVYHIQSPDGKIKLSLTAGESLIWSVQHENTEIITPSEISMTLGEGVMLGKNVKVSKSATASVNNTFSTPFYKKKEVLDQYNNLTLNIKGNYGVEFRAYNDGVAYHFFTSFKDSITVYNEAANFNFAGDYKVFAAYINDNRGGERYTYSFESFYDEIRLSEMTKDSLAINPLLIDLGNGKKAVVLESDVEDYPGMFLTIHPETRRGLKGEFAPYTLEAELRGINFIATKRADYLGKTSGTRSFPWRAVVISAKDAELANNDMVQKLASPSRIADASWIKPGKVSWDWWNNNNITGVNFKSGKNTATYKYFIDFASANHLEYIILDGGWSRNALMSSVPAINLEELVAYGKQKNVDLILWSSWADADKMADVAFPKYAAMGIKGFKVDFLDSDDQRMMRSAYRIAQKAAENKLLLDLHGFRATGMQRTYPNVVNFEGVKGLENFKWAPIINEKIKDDAPRYDVTIPYIRMMAGPMDYTPGAMRNANKANYRSINDNPMSQGTRVHQMAMYTIFEAPLQMLSDNPTIYMKEQECTDFIAKVPTVFDQTVALDGQVGEFVSIARRKGDTWFVGAMTNWTARELSVDFSFLGEGNFEAEIFSDGINADKEATDYKKEIIRISSKDKITVKMNTGGGWTARIYPVR
ncbi:MAG: glycoside hydrolase family 97 protein [Bacteroidales bacterium]|nr:glycoside hydrolase family 97 protein [Bacteroidales bacterium]